MKNKVFFSDEKNKLQEQESLDFEYNPFAEWMALNIYSDLKFQKIYGFGGAFTDASAITYSKMSDKTKAQFIDLMFDKNDGLGYNFCRTTINSCDFSADEYTYVDENDKSLKSFDISHDKQCIIPMIKDAAKKCDDLFLFATPWSPPGWMKDTNRMIQGGKLKEKMYAVWAQYYVKYIQEYQKSGVKINGLTIQNEPMATQTWESCFYTIKEQILFATDYLYPALKSAGLQDTKIMVWDHNKEHLYEVAREIEKIQGAKDKIFGIAFHWYSGEHFDNLRFAHETSPNMFLAASEFCFGGLSEDWKDALEYAYDISGNFNNYMNASCDWNILLDEKGGPYHNRKLPCKAVVHYDTNTDKIKIMPHYYAVKHFSNFIKKGAVRLGTSTYSSNTSISAFLNESGETVAVITNNHENEQKCLLRFNDYAAEILLKPKSIVTIVIDE
ncbi:MAG: glycoside hydrolase family 30 beta sandwich domain-containing protein [Acutalibacteraceae bacterium]